MGFTDHAGVRVSAEAAGSGHLARPGSGTYHSNGRNNGALNTFTLNRLYFLPCPVIAGFAYGVTGVRVGTVASAGGVARMGLYKREWGGVIGDLIVDGGTVATDGSTGTKTVATPWTADRPGVFVGLVMQVSLATINSINNNGIVPGGGLYDGAGEAQGYYYQDGVTGALPTTPTPAGGAAAWPTPCVLLGA